MRKRLAQLVLVFLLVLPALVLTACGSKEESPSAATSTQESAAQEATQEEGLFEGREARDISEMEPYKQKALENAKAALAVTFDGKEEADLIDELSKEFEEANDYYRKGDYKQAKKGYEAILKTYPQHYGANVNLSLTLLQEEKNEEGLVQTLKSLALNPADDGIPLNVQTAAVACGFAVEDAEEVANEVVKEMGDAAQTSTKLEHGLRYNRLWDRIETELWKAAQDKGNKKQNLEAYNTLHDELVEEAEDALSDDKDARALLAYLEAVGKQLGLDAEDEDSEEAEDSQESDESKESEKSKEADESKKTKDSKETKDSSASSSSQKQAATKVDFSTVEPHEGLPYVVVDDDLCTVVFTGYHMASDKPVAEFTMLNKTADKRLRMQASDAHANGTEIQDFSGAFVYVDPGEQGSGWGSFFGMDGDDVISLVKGELEELTCVVTVADVTDYPNEVITTVPMYWKASTDDDNVREVDQKLIDQEDVFSLTATGIRGASDDTVAIEYSSSYSGKGNISFGSQDDWKVNGEDMVLLGDGMSFEKGSGWHHFILLKAKYADSLGDEPVKTIEGTLIVMDADGKEIAAQKVEL